MQKGHLAPQGLAHYLEHMLFMGSEKYPGEGIQWRADKSWLVKEMATLSMVSYGKLPVNQKKWMKVVD